MKQASGVILQLDGDMSGPVVKGQGLGSDEDLLAEHSLAVIREFIEDNKFGSSGFSLLGLVPSF